MRRIGFPISLMDGEKRRGLLPADLAAVKNRGSVMIETGYGDVLGIPDGEYIAAGAMVGTREEVLSCEVICEPKAGEADYLDSLAGRTVFGWLHAVRNREISDALVASGADAYAWEDMYEKDGTHTFAKNNFMAGEAGVYHSFMVMGMTPNGRRVAVLGGGNAALGAISMLKRLGAEVVQYLRKDEARFREEMSGFDAIVNAVKWDITRTDHIIYRSDLARLRRGCLLVDISCDKAGAVETSVPTLLSDPVYFTDGIAHYVVSNIPTLLYRDVSAYLSSVVARFIDPLVENRPDPVLQGALIISRGKILDPKIVEYRKAHGI